MRVVRKGCFETNSSSAHAVITTKNDAHINRKKLVWSTSDDSGECLFLYSDGKWDLRNIGEGFGRWPFRMLTTFEEKFKYAMCEYLGCLYEDDPEWQRGYDEFKRIASEEVPGFTDFRISTKEIDIYVDQDGNDILQKDLHYDHYNEEERRSEYYYLDAEGNKKPAVFNEDYYLEMPNIGMIDHQSAGLLKNFLSDKGISLQEFLTNKKYVIVVDGDEYEDFDRYLKAGLINKDFIEEIYDRSGEDVEWEDWKKENANEESNS